VVAIAALCGIVPPVEGAGPAQQVSPDGAVFTFGTGPAGEAVLTIDAGELHVEKSVSPDGSTILVLRARGEEVRLELTQDRVAVTSDQGKVSFVADGSDENGQRAVRVALARSRAVQMFRSLAAAASARGRKTAFDEALALSGALIAQLAGDPNAFRSFTARHRSLKQGGVKPAGLRSTVDCWGQYERFISWAWDQYLNCIVSHRGLISGLTYCEFQYYMRAESAWFQFLSCSAIPIV
jgi:hypothetical protein